ncbi:MAG: tRNA (N(6)-L-threonylcarbamoyladenosine(37)-C(2))-methylthiotransferase MtaB [Nitrospirota bacterium]|nr:tRNA (N(6)-L-threonylcarbamoyladenosine(37)-C(2))-methylthiotransferase MtaB [Nitrospirota bacterium]MDH5585584.1 tRNA (N(6)-L-threonylcarbamoyladenosine(37)-C(2))-methylthiotransferase MtaB [Nitrospirota bacterium]MDH5774175.1 tRNA (N(6)-L-threonylcarbamoyladenosine(37)-C(2))-methylthiotransferase MtaB [Nitrospirota bacterium]
MPTSTVPQRRVAFSTIGCRLNQAETALLKDGFRRRGFLPVEYGQDTDVLVLNSCTVTEGAEAECRRLVRQTLRHSPQAFVAVTGCYAQTGLEVLRHIDGIDLIVGNQFKMQLPDLLPAVPQQSKQSLPQVHHERLDPDNFSIEGVGDYSTTRAHVKIQDGCQFMCAFCLIPFARGRERSRFADDAVREAEGLVQRGHRELVLTGVNIGRYQDQGLDLLGLITRLEAIEGLERIRISSIEPTTIPEGLLEYMKTSRKLCRFLHVPLQSGDDGILQSMNRRYSVQEYRKAMDMAVDMIPDVCFGTDVMVGFPGEGQREFANTVAFIRDQPFAYVHVFSYSPRPGTASTKMAGQVSAEDIKQRSQTLRDLSGHKREMFHQRFMGRELSVLFEHEVDGVWSGLTDQYLRVDVRASRNLKNTIQSVIATGVMSDRLLGLLPLQANDTRTPLHQDLLVLQGRNL